MRSTGSRGATLMEALIITAVIGVVLLVTANLFRGFTTLLRHSQQKNQQFEVANKAMESVCADLEQARTVTPALNSVSFDRLSPTDSLPALLPNGFDPLAPSRHLDVTYRLDSQRRLIREGLENRVLAEPIDGFSVVVNDRLLTINLTIRSDTRVVPLQREVFWWGRP